MKAYIYNIKTESSTDRVSVLAPNSTVARELLLRNIESTSNATIEYVMTCDSVLAPRGGVNLVVSNQ